MIKNFTPYKIPFRLTGDNSCEMGELTRLHKQKLIGVTENYTLKRRRATVFWPACEGLLIKNSQSMFENEPSLEMTNDRTTIIKIAEIDTIKNIFYLRLNEYEENLEQLEKWMQARFVTNLPVDLIGENEKLVINTPLAAQVSEYHLIWV